MKPNMGYWVVTEARELAGVIEVSEILLGAFCSGYLGYYAFVPHEGRGYMTIVCNRAPDYVSYGLRITSEYPYEGLSRSPPARKPSVKQREL